MEISQVSSRILKPLQGAPVAPWLWLGTWSLGGERYGLTAANTALETLHSAIDAGIRHFDTAGFYARGESERRLAQLIGQNRKELFLSSKGGLLWKGNAVAHCADPATLRRTLVESLERLGTDYLDLYQLHWPDPNIPISESIAALKSLQSEGLIRYWGIGNFTASEIQHHLADATEICHQVRFNPFHRADRVLEAGEENNRCINCVISPLEQGLFFHSGSQLPVSAVGKKDVRRRNPYFSNPDVQKWLADFHLLREGHPMSCAAIVLLWILAHPAVHTIVPGPRTPGQLAELLDVLNWIKTLPLPDRAKTSPAQWTEQIRQTITPPIYDHLEAGVPSICA